MFKITNVTIKKEEKGNLLGYAAIIIENSICITNLRIIQGKERVFVAMPSRKIKDKFKDIIFPINHETRKYIEETILQAFHQI